MARTSPAEFLRTSPLRLYTWGLATLLAYGAYDKAIPPRNSLPEPFDVSDHSGSAISTFPIGVLIGAGIVKIAEKCFPNADPRRVQAATIISGGLAGFVVNKGVEIVQGEIVEFASAHPDSIATAVDQFMGGMGEQAEDPYYGAVGGAAGGALAKPSAYLQPNSDRTRQPSHV
jgi:hypothetical protein